LCFYFQNPKAPNGFTSRRMHISCLSYKNIIYSLYSFVLLLCVFFFSQSYVEKIKTPTGFSSRGFLLSNIGTLKSQSDGLFFRQRQSSLFNSYSNIIIITLVKKKILIFYQNKVLIIQAHGPASSVAHDEVGRKKWVPQSCMTRFRQGPVLLIIRHQG
jgi:hypothetical protein